MSQTPYAVTNDQQQPPKDNTLKIVLIVLGIVILAVILICGGIMAAGYFAAQRMATEFQDEVWGEYASEILEVPEAKEALGERVSISISMTDEDPLSGNVEIRVIGSKASGTLITSTDDEGNEVGRLLMDDGRIIDLSPPEDDMEIDKMMMEGVELDVAPSGS